MITAISHMTFVVRDLERSSFLWKQLFDAKQIYSSGERTFSLSRENFFLVGALWVCLMEGDPLQARSYNHIAFQIEDGDYDFYTEKIQAMGLEMRPPRPRIPGEGRSIYFYDYDNHLFELHAGTLGERLRRYRQGGTS